MYKVGHGNKTVISYLLPSPPPHYEMEENSSQTFTEFEISSKRRPLLHALCESQILHMALIDSLV